MVTVTEIPDSADTRGSKFTVPWPVVGRVGEVHLAELLPGAVRGNHFHRKRSETLLVFPAERFSLYYDSGEGTPVEKRTFATANAVVARIDPHSAHAIVNEGSAPLWICSIGDTADDAKDDTFRRVLV